MKNNRIELRASTESSQIILSATSRLLLSGEDASDELEKQESKGQEQNQNHDAVPTPETVLLVQPEFLMADADPQQLLTEMAIERWSVALSYNLDRHLGPAN